MSIASRIADAQPIPSVSADEAIPVPPAVARCPYSFARDLPALLDTPPLRWVAYVDGNQVRIADTQAELYRHCLNELGLDHDRFIIACIVPESGGR
ncbi:hypothetical protein [Frigoriglobus tundricola]|uniref:Uncharacterized protein n=1 Tax=Frigoriglobus tundricola TaxID=2774151 RepID=A0A6M5YZ50_9BACT|nr:hypothetical protein [Frigoriglobus tundricola]QJW99407.1 hypothetical protein FTUN_7019 [Frigoriglobus tundricola]